MATKELIILGTGHSRQLCEFDCETWGVCAAYAMREIMEKQHKSFRLEKLFITDHLFSPLGVFHFDITRINRLKRDYGTEVITLHSLNLGRHKLPTKRYPLRQMIEKFETEYFTSSICYALAYAIHKNTIRRNGELILKRDGLRKLRLFGVDMLTKDEYRIQKGGVEYWLGIARGLGIRTEVAQPSAVLATPTGRPYGIDIKLDLEQVDPYNLLGGKR